MNAETPATTPKSRPHTVMQGVPFFSHEAGLLFPEDMLSAGLITEDCTSCSANAEHFLHESLSTGETERISSEAIDMEGFDELWDIQHTLNGQRPGQQSPALDHISVLWDSPSERDPWEKEENQEGASASSSDTDHRQALIGAMEPEPAASEETTSSVCSALSPAQKEKKRLIAWTPEEHRRFVVALEKLRTEDTEAVDATGRRSKGLGPGIAEVIAVAVGTRNAAQVRSHAQKHFAKQRRMRGW